MLLTVHLHILEFMQNAFNCAMYILDLMQNE